MSSDVKDPAQEFAERVVRKWYYEPMATKDKDRLEKAAASGSLGSTVEQELATLIASELRAGGWVQDEDVVHADKARKVLAEIRR